MVGEKRGRKGKKRRKERGKWREEEREGETEKRNDKCQREAMSTSHLPPHIHIVRLPTGDFIGCCRGQPEVKVQTK